MSPPRKPLPPLTLTIRFHPEGVVDVEAAKGTDMMLGHVQALLEILTEIQAKALANVAIGKAAGKPPIPFRMEGP